MNYVALCVVGGLALLLFAFLASAIRVVPEYSASGRVPPGPLCRNEGTRDRAPHSGHRPGC